MTLIIKDARQIADLNSHKLEFVAENSDDIAEHLVVVDAEGTPGQFYRPHRMHSIDAAYCY